MDKLKKMFLKQKDMDIEKFIEIKKLNKTTIAGLDDWKVEVNENGASMSRKNNHLYQKFYIDINENASWMVTTNTTNGESQKSNECSVIHNSAYPTKRSIENNSLKLENTLIIVEDNHQGDLMLWPFKSTAPGCTKAFEVKLTEIAKPIA